MNFHFPVMPRLFMSLRLEHRTPIVDIMEQTPEPPPGGQWATFLRNHDELTLEMVTDEERDLMLRAYATDARDAHQPRHPPPAGAAARQRPAQDRAAQRPAVLAARHAGHLLRRRDRDGRQRLPRRPQRRAHADAVVGRPQRRVLDGQPAPPVPAADHRAGLPLRERQRRDAGGQPGVAAVVDAPADRPAQAPPRARPRHDRVPRARQPPRAGVRPPPTPDMAERAAAAVRRQPVPARPAGRARPARASPASVPVEVFGQNRFAPIGDRPYSLTLAPYGFFWFALDDGQTRRRPAPRRRRRAAADRRVAGRAAPAGARSAGRSGAGCPGRRWFAGKGAIVRDVASTTSSSCRDDVALADRARRRSPRATTTGTPCRCCTSTEAAARWSSTSSGPGR